jgi:predicted RNA-binding Zn-ribbon protein involved in translation (DUF1610 family)
VLAAVSVGLGTAQVIFIRWIETRLAHGRAVVFEGVAFAGYLALVGWLLWRMQRRLRAARIRCPHCGVLLRDMSESVAAATGKCDSCGGQILEETQSGRG